MTDQSKIPQEFRSYSLSDLARIMTEGGRPVSQRTLRDHCDNGSLKAVKVGSSWRVSHAVLQEFLQGSDLAPRPELSGLKTTTSSLKDDPAAFVSARQALDYLKEHLRIERARRAQIQQESEDNAAASLADLFADAAPEGPRRQGHQLSGGDATVEEALDILPRPETDAVETHDQEPSTTSTHADSGLVATGEELKDFVAGVLNPSPSPQPETLVVEEFHGNHSLKMRCETSQQDDLVLRHGAYESWFDNGQQAARGEYSQGQLDGPWQQWHENGQPHCVGQHQQGLQVGSWTWWDDNGRLAQEGSFRRGQAAGIWIQYHANGEKWAQGRYENGETIGAWVYWDKDGQACS